MHSGCWCQKQPCTNITVLCLGKTISGQPASLRTCILKRKPISCSMERTLSSGVVSLLLIRRIRELLAGDVLKVFRILNSTIKLFRNKIMQPRKLRIGYRNPCFVLVPKEGIKLLARVFSVLAIP